MDLDWGTASGRRGLGAEIMMDTSCCCGAGNGDLFRDIRAVLAPESELVLLRKYGDDRMLGAGS